MQFFQDIIRYQNNFPYENRAGAASLVMHTDPKSFERSFRYRSELPTRMLFYVTRVFASKKFAGDVRELRDGVESVRQAND